MGPVHAPQLARADQLVEVVLRQAATCQFIMLDRKHRRVPTAVSVNETPHAYVQQD
jgi:hypothetical protein